MSMFFSRKHGPARPLAADLTPGRRERAGISKKTRWPVRPAGLKKIEIWTVGYA
jgi:hypothetical protein